MSEVGGQRSPDVKSWPPFSAFPPQWPGALQELLHPFPVEKSSALPRESAIESGMESGFGRPMIARKNSEWSLLEAASRDWPLRGGWSRPATGTLACLNWKKFPAAPPEAVPRKLFRIPGEHITFPRPWPIIDYS